MKLGIKALALSTVLGGGALSSAGCAENESVLFIVGVLALEDTDCKLTPESSATLRTRGVLDLSLRNGYTAGLLVGSQLTQRGSRDQLRTETARLSLRGAEVSLETPDGGVLAEYTTIGTGFVDPAGGSEPGFGAIAADLIPPGAPLAPGLVVARVRVFGDTLGGQTIESNEYPFPIYVCSGCLVNYPVDAADTTQGPGIYVCALRSDEATVVEDKICALGQDVVVPCTICAAQSPVCQDPCQNCSSSRDGLDCTASPVPVCP
jgi:hypothetical protein